ncbi:unnamed protein product [Lota lota]
MQSHKPREIQLEMCGTESKRPPGKSREPWPQQRVHSFSTPDDVSIMWVIFDHGPVLGPNPSMLHFRGSPSSLLGAKSRTSEFSALLHAGAGRSAGDRGQTDMLSAARAR